jgi:hypothetical protein
MFRTPSPLVSRAVIVVVSGLFALKAGVNQSAVLAFLPKFSCGDESVVLRGESFAAHRSFPVS